MTSFFADSVFAQHKLTHQVRQFDAGLLSPSPRASQSILDAVAEPSAQAVAAEAASQARAVASGVDEPSDVKVELSSHSDEYKNWFDSWIYRPEELTGTSGVTAHGDAYRDLFDSMSIVRSYDG